MFRKFAWIVIVTAALCGCTAKQDPVASAKADEDSVRKTLATVADRINHGDINFVNVFAKDAVIISPGVPDIAGFDAIRSMYAGIMQTAAMEVHFSTEEVSVAGDLAYEHGTYTLKMTDKASGRTLQDVKNKDVHILKRQPDGSWKTWRMMVNSAETPAATK
jgi:uncharacterized protein (TIGR02246 family)